MGSLFLTVQRAAFCTDRAPRGRVCVCVCVCVCVFRPYMETGIHAPSFSRRVQEPTKDHRRLTHKRATRVPNSRQPPRGFSCALDAGENDIGDAPCVFGLDGHSAILLAYACVAVRVHVAEPPEAVEPVNGD